MGPPGTISTAHLLSVVQIPFAGAAGIVCFVMPVYFSNEFPKV